MIESVLYLILYTFGELLSKSVQFQILTDYMPITPYGIMYVMANYTIWREKNGNRKISRHSTVEGHISR